MLPKIKRGELKRVKKDSPEEVEKNARTKFNEKTRSERVEEELNSNGITLFNNSTVDSDYLQLPAYLDEVQSNELGRYLHTFTQQKIWVRTLISRVSAMLREKEEELIPIKERVFSSQDKKMSITEKELKLFVHPEAQAIMDDIQYLQEKQNMLSEYMENLVDGIFSISREISRREGDFRDSNRVENINNKRRVNRREN